MHPRTKHSQIAVCALLAGGLLLSTSPVEAERSRGSYVRADTTKIEVVPPRSPNSHSSNIIYLNGCFGAGCDITPGDESSINNTSSIVGGSSHVLPFTGDQESWQAIVNCVRDTYAPFDIIVTDQDPSPAEHFEAVVAGEPGDVGMPDGVAGVAPFVCGGVINNAITYTFATVLENDIAETCWTVAQETAHAFGLDHEFLCSDPMTYLQSCDANKRFQDANAPCGEFQARACECNGSTQNSYQLLLEHFGAGLPTPPTIEISSPAEGDPVEPGFIVRSTATDDIVVDRVELRINSVLVGVSETAPYVFNVPQTLSDGRLQVEATAFDNYGYNSTASVQVVQGDPCTKSSQCAELEVCVAGRCVPGPEVEGGLGQECTSGTQCLSGDCGRSSDGNYCTEQCGEGFGGCPGGFGCLDTGETSVCWPGYKKDDGGCSTGKGAGSLTWLLALGLLAMARRRR